MSHFKHTCKVLKPWPHGKSVGGETGSLLQTVEVESEICQCASARVKSTLFHRYVTHGSDALTVVEFPLEPVRSRIRVMSCRCACPGVLFSFAGLGCILQLPSALWRDCSPWNSPRLTCFHGEPSSPHGCLCACSLFTTSRGQAWRQQASEQ